jgi:hypothetical protein
MIDFSYLFLEILSFFGLGWYSNLKQKDCGMKIKIKLWNIDRPVELTWFFCNIHSFF